MTNNPLISIVIPVYNGANYLKEAIESALRQDYEPTEIIMVDDGSNDNGATRNIAEQYVSKIRYIYKENGGVSSALNVGLHNMNGELFSWLSHDDLYKTNRLRVLKDHIENMDENTILTHDYDLIDSDGRHIRRVFELTSEYHTYPFFLLKGCRICGCACLIPRKLLISVGGFNQELRYAQDFEMWIKIAAQGYKQKHVPQSLTKSRVHIQQYTWTATFKLLQEEDKVQQLAVNNFLSTPEQISSVSQQFNYKNEKRMLLSFFLYYYHIRRLTDTAELIARIAKKEGVTSVLDLSNTLGCFLRMKIVRWLAFLIYYLHRLIKFKSMGSSVSWGSIGMMFFQRRLSSAFWKRFVLLNKDK